MRDIPPQAPGSGQWRGGDTGSSSGSQLAKRGGGKQRSEVDPLSERSRFAGAEYAINRSLFGPLDERDPERAIRAALGFWNVEVSASHYTPELDHVAETQFYESGAIVIRFGPAALTSARWLMSTAYHEGVTHVRQFLSGNYATQGTGFFVNELEAIDGERGIAVRLGLSTGEIGQLNSAWDAFYLKVVGTPYQNRVDAGNFQLF